jgi:hypothetical protein
MENVVFDIEMDRDNPKKTIFFFFTSGNISRECAEPGLVEWSAKHRSILQLPVKDGRDG